MVFLKFSIIKHAMRWLYFLFSWFKNFFMAFMVRFKESFIQMAKKVKWNNMKIISQKLYCVFVQWTEVCVMKYQSWAQRSTLITRSINIIVNLLLAMCFNDGNFFSTISTVDVWIYKLFILYRFEAKYAYQW